MCDPIVLGIASGVGTFVTGVAEQNRAHRAQVDAVNRSNAIARQKYINDIKNKTLDKIEIKKIVLTKNIEKKTYFYKCFPPS